MGSTSINIKTALEFNMGLQTPDPALRLGHGGSGRGVGQSVVRQNVEQVLVGDNHFVVGGVYRHRAIRGKGIADPADGLCGSSHRR
jgi:hypothetical protein